jgi:tetratricopeptide (TPR) repeat protein
MGGGRHLRRAQRLARQGRTEPAREKFRAAAERRPRDFRVHLQRARFEADQDHPSLALEAIRKAEALAPNHPVPRLFHGYLLCRFQRFDQAEAILRALSKAMSGNRMASTCLAWTRLGQGRIPEALPALAWNRRTDNLEALSHLMVLVEQMLRARQPNREPTPAPERGGLLRAEKMTEYWSAKQCLKAGVSLVEDGFNREAIPYLERALAKSPAIRFGHIYLGCARFETGKYAEALSVLGCIPDDDPLKGIARFYEGAALYRLGRYPEAAEHLALARNFDIFGYEEWLSYYTGLVHMAMEQLVAAATCFARVIDSEASFLSERLEALRACPPVTGRAEANNGESE